MKMAKTLWIKRTDILNKFTADILTFFLISASEKKTRVFKQTGTQSCGTGTTVVYHYFLVNQGNIYYIYNLI